MNNVEAQVQMTQAQQGMLTEKWSKQLNLVESAKEESMTPEYKGTMAQLLENTNNAFTMLEATDYNQTNGVKQFAIDLVSVVVPNLVSQDIVSVQAMSNQVR